MAKRRGLQFRSTKIDALAFAGIRGIVLPEKIAIDAARAALAQTGVLRAAINLGNFLLVSDHKDSGVPIGIAPDLAAEIASRLGVPVRFVCYQRPDELAGSVDDDAWDIGLIGAEPARARSIAFTSAYAEIECTYLVPAGSSIAEIREVDRAGIRIASAKGAAYDLWLKDNLQHATLVHAKTLGGSFETFVSQQLDALAGLRPRLLEDIKKLPGARILRENFSAVQQAIGTKRSNVVGASFLSAMVEEAKRSGLIASLIEKHAVKGLSATK